MLPRKFELNRDAVMILTLLFVLSLGINFVQYRAYADLAGQANKLELQGLIDSFNLDSLDKQAKGLKSRLEACDASLEVSSEG